MSDEGGERRQGVTLARVWIGAGARRLARSEGRMREKRSGGDREATGSQELYGLEGDRGDNRSSGDAPRPGGG